MSTNLTRLQQLLDQPAEPEGAEAIAELESLLASLAEEPAARDEPIAVLSKLGRSTRDQLEDSGLDESMQSCLEARLALEDEDETKAEQALEHVDGCAACAATLDVLCDEERPAALTALPENLQRLSANVMAAVEREQAIPLTPATAPQDPSEPDPEQLAELFARADRLAPEGVDYTDFVEPRHGALVAWAEKRITPPAVTTLADRVSDRLGLGRSEQTRDEPVPAPVGSAPMQIGPRPAGGVWLALAASLLVGFALWSMLDKDAVVVQPGGGAGMANADDERDVDSGVDSGVDPALKGLEGFRPGDLEWVDLNSDLAGEGKRGVESSTNESTLPGNDTEYSLPGGARTVKTRGDRKSDKDASGKPRRPRRPSGPALSF